MSVYGFTVTTAGEALLAQAAGSGQALVITGTQVGSGAVENAAAAKALTALLSPQQAGTYSTPQINGGQISLIVEYRNNLNGGLTSGFSLNEFGIFARVGAGQATLLAYGSLGDSPAAVHPIADGLETYRYPVAMAFSGDLEVTVEDPSGAFVTDDALAQYVPLSQKGQPGGVAGLDSSGKVPEEQLPDMDYLPLAGGTMTGAIAMGGHKITGLGAPSASSDAARLQEVNSILSTVNGGWVLLDELATAGSGTWIAPDPFGDGQPYQIGVLVIGAGASGGAAAVVGASYARAAASGGASGRMTAFIMTVTPGQTINYVVGSKGARALAQAGDAPLDREQYTPGNNGGTSSFHGVTADGGEGGRASTRDTSDSCTADGARGGQCSRYVSASRPDDNIDGAWGGEVVNRNTSTQNSTISAGFMFGFSAFDTWNPFECRKMLCSGGGASTEEVSMTAHEGAGGEDPISQIAGHGQAKGGDGDSNFVLTASSGNSASAQGENAVGVANGGGGATAAIKYTGSDGNWPTATANSGAGTDGAIWIYIQGKEAEAA